jgi:osmotically-inducible protein OsmY
MQRRTDDQVRADVEAALFRAPVDEMAITVGVRDGVVELAGELASYSERLAAATAARDAAFPVPVQSSLTVAPQGRDFQLTDADVAIEVARALVQSEIPPGSVIFEVKNRIVTLRGRLATTEQRALARHLVQSARGVHFIDNRITVDAAASVAH